MEHLADLEAPEPGLGGLQVAAGRLQQLPMQGVAQVAVVGEQRVGQRNPPPTGLHQRQGAAFLQTSRRQRPPQPALRLLLGGQATWLERIRQMGRELVVAHQPRHLLDQIHLAAQVDGALRRHLHQPAILGGRQGAAERLQGGFDARIGQILLLAVNLHRPQQVVQGIAPQLQGLRRTFRPSVAPAAHHRGAGQLLQERHSLVGGGQGDLAGQPLLKAAAGLAAQADAAGGTAHRLRGEDGRLQPDIRRRLADGLLQTTHHTGQGDRAIGMGDHQGVFAQGALLTIEGDEPFAGPAGPQAHLACIGRAARSTGQRIPVEGMQGLAGLEHHQVGDVHHVVDRTHSGPLQALLQPGRRRAHLHTLQGREAEQSALFHAGQVRGGGSQRLERRRLRNRVEVCAATAEGRHLPGDAPHRQAVGAVGGDRQLQHLIVEPQGRTHRLSHGGDGLEQRIEHGDAVAAVGQAEFLERADHAAAGHAAQLGRFDRQIHGGEGAADQRHRHMDAGPDVGGAADDLQRLSIRHPHLADAQLVGVRVGGTLLDVADDDALGQGGEILDLLDFEARDREPLRQLGGLELIWLHLHQFLQPLERDPHRTHQISRPDPRQRPRAGSWLGGTGGEVRCSFNLVSRTRRNVLPTMAKNKGVRIVITLECTECRSNPAKRSAGVSRYTTQKNRRNTTERLELKKFCPHCNSSTTHKEIK